MVKGAGCFIYRNILKVRMCSVQCNLTLIIADSYLLLMIWKDFLTLGSLLLLLLIETPTFDSIFIWSFMFSRFHGTLCHLIRRNLIENVFKLFKLGILERDISKSGLKYMKDCCSALFPIYIDGKIFWSNLSVWISNNLHKYFHATRPKCKTLAACEFQLEHSMPNFVQHPDTPFG